MVIRNRVAKKNKGEAQNKDSKIRANCRLINSLRLVSNINNAISLIEMLLDKGRSYILKIYFFFLKH